MSYYGKSLYLDFDTLPRANHRFSLGRVLAKGTSANIYHGVDHEAGIHVFPFLSISDVFSHLKFIGSPITQNKFSFQLLWILMFPYVTGVP